MNNSKSRAELLAERLLEGAELLRKFAEGLTDAEWGKPVLGDGRSIGVVVHHVASAYPVEIELTKILANGNAITEVTKEAVDKMNADHALKNNKADRAETLSLLETNSAKAAREIGAFSDEELDNSAPVSLYFDAPLTAQFFIEDHALRHSFHHLGKIKASL